MTSNISIGGVCQIDISLLNVQIKGTLNPLRFSNLGEGIEPFQPYFKK